MVRIVDDEIVALFPSGGQAVSGLSTHPVNYDTMALLPGSPRDIEASKSASLSSSEQIVWF